MTFDWDGRLRGAAALFAASMLLVRDVDGSRDVRMAAVLQFVDDMLERGWRYVDEPEGGDPAAGLFFIYGGAPNEDTGTATSVYCNAHPAEGTIAFHRSVAQPGYVDLDPRAWFTFDQVGELAAVLDAVPELGHEDGLPAECYQYGAIVEWGDPFYESTLSIEQVANRRFGAQSTPAHEVLDAMREVYDTCPSCGTYTGGQPHHCG